jgi:hypothetical protein
LSPQPPVLCLSTRKSSHSGFQWSWSPNKGKIHMGTMRYPKRSWK